MDKDVLQQVIDTEKEIEQAIESEKKKINAWLSPIRTACEDELTRERERLRQDFQAAVAKGRQQAEQAAGQRLAACKNQATALDTLTDRQLQEIILKHLAVILPQSSS